MGTEIDRILKRPCVHVINNFTVVDVILLKKDKKRKKEKKKTETIM